MKLLVVLLAGLCAFGCSSGDVYQGEDHPYRVLMRDMKPHYKTLENFSKDAKLKDDALEACVALQKLGNTGSQMEPGFLNPEQVSAHQRLFTDIAFAAKNHAAYISSGQIEEAQGLFDVLGKIKKQGHTDYKDQAKKHRGEDSK